MPSFTSFVFLCFAVFSVTRTDAVSPGFCINEIMSPTKMLYEGNLQNYLMMTMCILYGITSVTWFLSLLVGRPCENRSVLDILIGLIATFSMVGSMNFIDASYVGIPVTFFFQTAANSLVAFCLLLVSNGHGITKSARCYGWNLFFATTVCVGYFCFSVAAVGGEQNGFQMEMARMVVNGIACFLLVLWVLVNVVFTYAKTITKSDCNTGPRRLFYQHFIELFCASSFCVYLLFITEVVGCSFNWDSYSYFITATIRSTVTFLLLTLLMVMLRPSRMKLIGFDQVQSSTTDDCKKVLVNSVVIADESSLEP